MNGRTYALIKLEYQKINALATGAIVRAVVAEAEAPVQVTRGAVTTSCRIVRWKFPAFNQKEYIGLPCTGQKGLFDGERHLDQVPTYMLLVRLKIFELPIRPQADEHKHQLLDELSASCVVALSERRRLASAL